MAIALYLYAALWTALVAEKLPTAPHNPILRYLGSLFLGLIWPVSWIAHYMNDIERKAP